MPSELRHVDRNLVMRKAEESARTDDDGGTSMLRWAGESSKRAATEGRLVSFGKGAMPGKVKDKSNRGRCCKDRLHAQARERWERHSLCATHQKGSAGGWPEGTGALVGELADERKVGNLRQTVRAWTKRARALCHQTRMTMHGRLARSLPVKEVFHHAMRGPSSVSSARGQE